MKKTIQKKHLVTQNPKKKGEKKGKGRNRDEDEEEEEKQEQISDHEEDSKYNMFKKKSEKK